MSGDALLISDNLPAPPVAFADPLGGAPILVAADASDAMLKLAVANVFRGSKGDPGDLSPDPWVNDVQASAETRFGKFFLVPSEGAVVVDVPGHFASLAEAFDGVALWMRMPSASVTIRVTGKIAETRQTNVRSAHKGVLLRGQRPLARALTRIVSVTGAAGDWSVTGEFADAAGVEVGDMLQVDGVRAGLWTEPGLVSGKPLRGELMMMYYQLGSLTTVGAAASVGKSGANCLNNLENGFLIYAKGDTRAISGVNASGFTLSGALTEEGEETGEDDIPNPLPDDVKAQQYWFAMRPASGTVTASGATVTGYGAQFLSQVNVGDVIFIAGFTPRRVTAIASDTQLTVAYGYDGINLPGVVSPAVFAIVTSGELHHAAWPVTAVDGALVTWTNAGRVEPPPVNNVVSGTISVHKSVVTWPASAFAIPQGGLDAGDIAFRGAGSSTSSMCFDQRGALARARGGDVALQPSTAIYGFGYGANIIKAHLDAAGVAFGGQRTRAISGDLGATGDLTGANIMGTGGIAVLEAGGSNIRGSNAKVGNCALQGLRTESGAGGWWDFANFTATGAGAVLYVGGVTGHLVGCRVFKSTGPSVQGQNGGFGRSSGTLIVSGRNAGYSFANGNWEANQSCVSGCEGGALVNNRGRFSMIGGGMTGNKTRGPYSLDRGDTTIDNCNVTQNLSAGVRADSDSWTRARNSALGPNGASYEIFASTGGKITIDGSTGYTGIFPAMTNTVQSNGSVIYKAGDPAPTAPAFVGATLAPGSFTVPAGSAYTFTATLPGLVAGGLRQTIEVSCNGVVNDSVLMRAQPHDTLADTAVVIVRNIGAGSVTLNRTWSLLAKRWAA